MTIRTDADIINLREQGDLTTAEETLIANCRAGKETVLGDGEVPDGPSDARTVRADLLRYLITGGCKACPTLDAGVDLTGAYVTGALDLKFATAKGETGLYHCRFAEPIEALQTRFEFLNLTRSHLPGLNAQGAQMTGDVFLNKVEAEGEVRLSGAVIGGQLACNGARFSNANGKALYAQGAKVTGDVFLRAIEVEGETKRFEAIGEVSLSGAVIGGQVSCKGARFSNAEGDALNVEGAQVTGNVVLDKVTAKGEVSLIGAVIGAQLDCEGARFENNKGKALKGQQMEAAALLWREVAAVNGVVDLNGARVADLVDDAASWKLVESLYLNGFRYESIHGPMTARMRLEWLAKYAATAGKFRPQPYEQLAHVMQSMGHTSDARRVRLEKEILLARDWKRRATEEQAELRARRDATPKPPDHHEIQKRLARIWLDLRVMPFWHGALRYMVGYGHAPQRVLAWAAATISVMGLFYLWVWNFGGMVPNSGIVLTSSHWASALAESPDFPSLAWVASETGQHYETFNAFAYAADVSIPLVDLGQEAAWTATTATAWGSLAWVLSWFLKLFGWIVTAVGAAAITGIIRRE